MPSTSARPTSAEAAATSAGSGAASEATPDIGVLYRQHADDVARWASRLMGHSADVEDIVHQVFLVAQRRLPEFRGEAKLSTWLHGITVRVVHEARRRYRRWWRWSSQSRGAEAADDGSHSEDRASEQPSALELLEKKEAGRIVYQVLDQLDEKYRTALILFELEGLSGEEVAAVTKTSVSNVWVRLLRGRQQFVKRFRAWESSAKRDVSKAHTP
jgi:RNA polymerase sigma-70 factor (ECF subfamily)